MPEKLQTEKKAVIAEGVKTVTFTLDGNELTVPKGTTVLEAAVAEGIDIPFFCWHPKLKPVGACRMCYIEIEKSSKLEVSCATEAIDGMVVHSKSDKVLEGRRAVIEFTLINHPLDCPTCDKGGECDLQDLTFAHGTDTNRFDYQKYRFTADGVHSTFDDLKIGPEIVLNRNRCILCFRCVRANKEAFGEYDLGSYERGDITEINAAPGQQVDNPFSGNLVEICPVGALTNSDWRYKIRVWLTEQTKSICPFTSSGTNILFYKERHKNRIYRVTSRQNDQIDDGWLADVTRYGYQIVHSETRLQTPLIRKENKQVEATWEEALNVIGKRFGEIREKKGSVCLAGMAHPGLDNATLYSLNKLLRFGLGSQNIDYRVDYRMLPETDDNLYSRLSSQPFSIADIDDSDLIIIIGSDLVREHPNEYLRIRKAVHFNNARVFTLNPFASKSGDVASSEIIYRIGADEALVNGICLAAIEDGFGKTSDADDLRNHMAPNNLAEAARLASVEIEDLKDVALSLARASKVTILVGEIVSRSRNRDQISAALCNLGRLMNIGEKGQMAILPRYSNTRGAELLGLSPHLTTDLKGRLKNLWGSFPDSEARSTDAMLARMRKEDINGMILMGADPVMLYPDQSFAREGLERLEFLVACDLFETQTTALADVVLPLASWAEYEGEYVNLEGKRQIAEAAIKPVGQSKTGSEIVGLIANKLGIELFKSEKELQDEIDSLLSNYETVALPNTWVKAEYCPAETDENFSVPLIIGDDPHHSGHLTEKSNSLTNFCGEAYVEISPSMAEKLRLSEGESVRVTSAAGKIIVPVRISEYLNNDVVFIPRNFSSTPVTMLLMRKRRIDWVKISKVDN